MSEPVRLDVWPRDNRDLRILLHWRRCSSCQDGLRTNALNLDCPIYWRLIGVSEPPDASTAHEGGTG